LKAKVTGDLVRGETLEIWTPQRGITFLLILNTGNGVETTIIGLEIIKDTALRQRQLIEEDAARSSLILKRDF